MKGWSSSMPVFTRRAGPSREPQPVREARISEKTDAWLHELLGDCAASWRLSTWERAFVGDIRASHKRFGRAMNLSEKQLQQLQKIEETIHAAG